MRVLSVVGARPQFVKLAPMHAAFAKAGFSHDIVHTGQHYDPELSDAFFADYGLPAPDVNLGVGSGSHGEQTGAMVTRLESTIVDRRPDLVLVYGDTNSTLAAAVAASKLRVPSAHLEAGLRSDNRAMPEEINRILTDHAVDLCLAPTPTAMERLNLEGLAARSVLVGDVMVDSTIWMRDRVIFDPPAMPFDAVNNYVLCTLHRPSNVDDTATLQQLLRGLGEIDAIVVLAAHPRLVARLEMASHTVPANVRLVPPLSHPQMICALLSAGGVVTDSGGLQKEAFLLRVPCTTLRAETEWVETLLCGWNVLDPGGHNLRRLATRSRPEGEQVQPFGDGNTAERAVAALVDAFAGGGD